MASADLDGDGKPDVVSSHFSNAQLSFLRNGIQPQSPANVTAAAGNGQVTLKWNAIAESRFLRYLVYMGTDSVTMALKDSSTASITDTSKTIAGLTNGSKYYFRVSALDSSRLESTQSYAVLGIPNADRTRRIGLLVSVQWECK